MLHTGTGRSVLAVLACMTSGLACHSRVASSPVPPPQLSGEQRPLSTPRNVPSGNLTSTDAPAELARQAAAVREQTEALKSAVQSLQTAPAQVPNLGLLQDLQSRIGSLNTAVNTLNGAVNRLESENQQELSAVQLSSQSATQSAQEATRASDVAVYAAINSWKTVSQSNAAQLRPTLGDYIPCRFEKQTSAQFITGNTQVVAGSESPVKQVVLDVASKNGTSASALGKISALLQSEPDVWSALSTAREQGLLSASTALQAAEKAATTLPTAPLDIGCSESVLSWGETNYIFGRAVADHYVAIQVNARNLNADQEFLIHDLQVAVGQFVSQADTSGSGHQSCTIYNADPNNLYNADATKSGAYTRFVAGRDRVMVRGVAETAAKLTPRNIAAQVIEVVGSILSATAPVAGGPSFSDAVHVFTAAAIPGYTKIFSDLSTDQLNRLNDLGFSAASAYKIVIPKNGAVPMTTFLSSDIFAKNYRKWSHCDLMNFEQNMVVVLAGKHIQEVNNQVKLDKMECPSVGPYLDISKANGNDFECQISGQNLQNLSVVRLKNAADLTDKNTADGTASVSGKTDAGTVKFSVKQLTDLSGKQYQAYAEPTTGSEQATGIKINMPPLITTLSPSKCTIGAGCKLDISGNNLDLLLNIQLLKSPDDKNPVVASVDNPGSNTASANIDLSTLKPDIKQPTDYLLYVTTKDKTTIDSGKKLTVNPATQ